MTNINNVIVLDTDFFSALSDGKDGGKNIIIFINDSEVFYKRTDGKFTKIIYPQFELVLSGSANILINYEKYTLKKGMFVIYPQYTVCKEESRSEDFKSVWFECNFEEIYDQELLYNLTFIDRLSDASFIYAVNYLDVLQKTARYDDPLWTSVRHLVSALINSIEINTKRKICNPDISTRSYEIYNQFMKLLRRNYDLSLTIDAYAEQLCISKSHLRNVIKQITGDSIMKLINAEIIRKTKMLLLGNMTIKAISERLNLADKNYFSQFFKKETGFTPSEFVKMKTRI
ncbi:MAG: helix-turn-helix transcriptional regulator [Bacteroidales bacterium]|nr:helix-turn-helix transcriptional regulator [Bacteroidales bacterium]